MQQREAVTVYWTRGEIVRAIKLWVEKHGTTPRTHEWDATQDDDYPPTCIVVRRFGSWNSAIRAAGFAPRQGGVARLPDEPRVKIEIQVSRALFNDIVLAVPPESSRSEWIREALREKLQAKRDESALLAKAIALGIDLEAAEA